MNEVYQASDRCPHGWLTVNEYLSDDLAKDSEKMKKEWTGQRGFPVPKLKNPERQEERFQSAVLGQICGNNGPNPPAAYSVNWTLFSDKFSCVFQLLTFKWAVFPILQITMFYSSVCVSVTGQTT